MTNVRQIGILAGRWATMEEVTDTVVFPLQNPS